MDQLKCVKNINIEKSNCYKKCEGMQITSYVESEIKSSAKQQTLKLSNKYNLYKGLNKFPTNLQGAKKFSRLIPNIWF